MRISILMMVVWTAPHAVAQQLDTAAALGALADAGRLCAGDGGALWGRSLCGPIALVDRQTRLVIANDTVPGRRWLPYGGGYVSTLPSDRFIANTSFTWNAREWTMVALPLPRDRYNRAVLVMHEVFHREQVALGLRQRDHANNHLDFREGRTWLRLELRALAAALRATDVRQRRRHVEDALLFRARRRSAYPGSDSLENSLEIQEGVPEYVGHRLAGGLVADGRERTAQHVESHERSQRTFVRSFAYATGPALGLLLDDVDPTWRSRLAAERNVAALLARAVGYRPPPDPRRLAQQRAAAYDLADVERDERSRDSTRAPMLAGYRERLVAGPTITLRQTLDSLSWGFDPGTLVALDMTTTVYPWGSFTAPWGSLNVTANGVAVANDFSFIRVAAPAAFPPSPDDRRIAGDGWTLQLNPGWSLRPDPDRAGSFIVER